MTGMDRDALDQHIAGGHYRKYVETVTCAECGTATVVTVEEEYGATDWTPSECPGCGTEYTGDEATVEHEPDLPDDQDEYGRFEPWA